MDTIELTQAASGDERPSDAPQTSSTSFDWLQLLFWGSLGVSVSVAVVAIVLPEATGLTGPVTLIAMALFALVTLLWVMRGAGRRLGLFPKRGAAAAAARPSAPRFQWIEALDEAVVVADTGGAILNANAAYRALAKKALGGLVELDRPPGPDRLFGAHAVLAAPMFRLSKAAKAKTGRREILPAIGFGEDGLLTQFEASVSPLSPTRAMWRFRPIQGSAEATGAADRKALYVEDAPVGFFASKPDGVVTYANGWLRELIGLPEDYGVLRIDDLMRPEFVKLLVRDKKSGAPVRADIVLRSRDGVETPVQTLTTWSGRGVESLARTLVISRQQAQLTGDGRQTAPSSSRPPRGEGDPMFDDAPFGAARLGGDGIEDAVILDANESLRDLSQGAAQPGLAFADLFRAIDDTQSTKQSLIDAVHKPVTLMLAGDDQRSVSVSVALDTLGRPSVAYVIDTTEQKELEHKLAHAEKMQVVGQLAGGVAHDFNNLLTVIMGRTETLLVRHPLGDPSYSDLKDVYEHGARAAEFVKSLLAYSRQQTFKQKVLDITKVVADLRRLLQQLLDERIKLDVVHGRDLPRVKADPHQIQTSLINLATNARDAMLAGGRSGGVLTVRTSRTTGADAHGLGFGYVEDGDYLLIEVSDTGAGMTQDVMAKIFEPFFTTKEQGQGTGLGLATVYGIIKQSGGYVCPTSKPGHGTTFRIYLPALRADEISEEDLREDDDTVPVYRPADLAGRGRVLLVEDEPGVRGITAQFLLTKGYDVEQACDGEEALELIEEAEQPFDLIVSDVIMPGIDGPTLIKKAQPYLDETRVIFISGYAERDLAKAIDETRNVSFLPKPFTQVQLAERVKEELSKRLETAA